MKKLHLCLAIIFFLASFSSLSNGVAIKNAANNQCFKLLESDVSVTVYDQIAIVVTTQKFLNNTGEKTKIKYAYPLNENASGTGLRWKLNGIWQSAVISPTPQDTTLPGGGGGGTSTLQTYLGPTALYFNLEDSIPNDSVLTVELTYVELLPYEFYEVDFMCRNDYTMIQNTVLDRQKMHFELHSQRSITNFELTSHTPSAFYFNDSTAGFDVEIIEDFANTNYHAYYELSPEDLGLFSYSTYITDTAFDCDDFGNGFFTFIVEPDPQSEVIQKVFTLIIDRSGSMTGNKIIQARDAASFIVNNLNEGDYFNIVDFASSVSNLFIDHKEFTIETQNQALDYIEDIYASGSTNISGAFSTAIPDFASSDTTLANIIIFFTDGHPTTGITNTDGILNHIQDQINMYEVLNLQIHTFGIGPSVNQSLLSQIASQNNGLSEFLGDDELEAVITEFYQKIRNPVLLNTEMTVDPPVLTEIYPNPLDNLYLGQQLIVVGRYVTADSITVSFSGEAFGQPQVYEYPVNLADSTIETYQFLTKLWAKKKMENLFVLYHTYDPNSSEAEEIKDEIIAISICYNVISPFTSYTGGGVWTYEEFDENMKEFEESPTNVFPNPFTNEATLSFVVKENSNDVAVIQIFDAFGKVVFRTELQLAGKGKYSIRWSGEDVHGNALPPGYYFFTIQYGNTRYTGKILKN